MWLFIIVAGEYGPIAGARREGKIREIVCLGVLVGVVENLFMMCLDSSDDDLRRIIFILSYVIRFYFIRFYKY